MKFGVREICNVVFRAKNTMKIGNSTFKPGQPVIMLDTATASSLEQAATTVYAQGGRGNSRLIAWEGEKTLTFTVTDALLSPIGLSILSGAGLIKPTDDGKVHYHVTTNAVCEATEIDLTNALAPFGADAKICEDAPIYVIVTDNDGSFTGTIIENLTVDATGKKLTGTFTAGQAVAVDYYVILKGASVSEIQIRTDNFAGYFYVEADTLFRRQSDGVDLPANITFPNVKIQSNFTFSMASTGDPGTFDFTMDAFPGYTYFNPNKQILCGIQILEDYNEAEAEEESVFLHTDTETIGEDPESAEDSVPNADEGG